MALLLLCIASLPGCEDVTFDYNYSSVAHHPLEPSHPLVGAWKGFWHKVGLSEYHDARAVIFLNSRGDYTINLELSAFDFEPNEIRLPFDAYCLEVRNLSFLRSPESAEEFATKMAIKKAYRSHLVSEAITLQGRIEIDALRIRFTTNDALTNLEQGEITLNRVRPPAGPP
jgi:hypothetical protein